MTHRCAHRPRAICVHIVHVYKTNIWIVLLFGLHIRIFVLCVSFVKQAFLLHFSFLNFSYLALPLIRCV